MNSDPENNTSADVDAPANSFVITVTPSVTGTLGSGATYSFDFDLNDYAFGTTATPVSVEYTSGDGTASPTGSVEEGITITGADATNLVAHEFTVTFATTTGEPDETITGTASSAALQSGGTNNTTYTGSYNPASVSVTVQSMPAIGGFQGL